MYRKRFLCWNLSFLALSIAAALVAVFPEYAGLTNQPPKLPETAVRHQDRVSYTNPEDLRIEIPEISFSESVGPEDDKYEPAEESVLSGSFRRGSLSVEQQKAANSTELESPLPTSARAKELARKLKNKNLFETDPYEPPTNVVIEDEKIVEVPVSPREKYTPPAALTYLKDFQHREGHWSATTHWPKVREGAFSFDKETACDTEYGWESDNIANSSLALLCYVSAGYDHTMGPFRAEVRRGLLYLRRTQDQQGRFSTNPRHHAMALMAFAETYGLSATSVLRPGCNKAIDALVKMQHADGGFGPDGASNVVDTGYAVLALKSARMSGLEHDRATAKTAHAYVESMRDENVVHYSASRSVPLHHGNGLMTDFPLCEAIWLFTGYVSSSIKKDDVTAYAMAERFLEEQNLPDWKSNNVDCQYYLFASKAMFQLGGEAWKAWHKATNVALLNSQRGYTELDKDNEWTSAKELFEFGSWDPVGVNGPRYGRIFTTAMCYLTLDVYARYYSSADDVVEHHVREEDPSAEVVRIIEDANDDVTEDNTDSPNEDLAPNPND